MNVFSRLLMVVVVACLAVGCQSVPQTPVSGPAWLDKPGYFSERLQQAQQRTAWRYSAKVGLNTPQVKEQANLVWEFRDQANSIRLFGPLGMGAIKLQFDDHGVVLSDNKGLVHRGNSAEELLTRIVGWPIPVDALRSWMFVLPTKDAAYRYALDDDKHVQYLEQLGWVIEYSSYKDYGGEFMPRKIVATKILPNESANANNSTSKNLDSSDGKKVVVKLITKSWN